MIYWTKSLGGRTTNYKINNKEIIIKQSLDFVAFTNFGKRFFIYIQAVSQCHSLCFPFFFVLSCTTSSLITSVYRLCVI